MSRPEAAPVTSPARRRRVARIGALALLALLMSRGHAARAQPVGFDADADGILRVPHEFGTVQEAVDVSRPDDVVLIARGTYPGEVEVSPDHEGITIRGVSRNDVVFDGDGVRRNAIDVEADGVTLENLSAHDFVGNGFYWNGVDGFAGRYLTVWNVGLYGIYAIQSRDGVFEHSFVSGAADAAFYIGECNPCDTLITDVEARLSAVGYSGTNAGGGLEVRDSVWVDNGAGILPNSFDTGLEPPPQHGLVVTGNRVTGSGTVPVPLQTVLAGFAGIGIGVAGGSDNVVEGNTVEGSDRYGIAVFSTMVGGGRWDPEGNEIRENDVRDSRIADLAMAAGSGDGNCFVDNAFRTQLPGGLDGESCPPGSAGDERVADDLADELQMIYDRYLQTADPVSYDTMPAPPRQPEMPGEPAADPGGEDRWALIGWLALFGAVTGVIALFVALAARWLLRPRKHF